MSYPADYGRVLRFSADHAGVPDVLANVTDAQRRPHPPDAVPHSRLVAADYLEDLRREPEADLLRSGRHVVFRDGRVHPGRWTHEPTIDAADAIDEHLPRMVGRDYPGLSPVIEDDVTPGAPDDHCLVYNGVDTGIHPDFVEHLPREEVRGYLADRYAEIEDYLDGEHIPDAHWHEFDRLLDALRTAPVEDVDPHG